MCVGFCFDQIGVSDKNVLQYFSALSAQQVSSIGRLPICFGPDLVTERRLFDGFFSPLSSYSKIPGY
jgi:hypothetical protein